MHTASRRDFISAAALAAAALSFPSPLFARTPYPTFYLWKEVKPGFFVALGRTGNDMALVGGNSTLITGKQFQNVDACLVDTKQAVLGPSLRREALIKTGAITRIINTHHHFDHAGGNAAFTSAPDASGKAQGTTLSAHPKCRERMTAGIAAYTAQLDQKITALEALTLEGAPEAAADAKDFRKRLAAIKPEAFVPEAIETDAVKSLASRKVELHHVGAGHTDNDLFLFFPDDNILITGDLIFNGVHAYYDASAGATSQGWLRSLARMITLCNQDTIVIPGHGEIGGIDTVRAQIKYLEDAHAAVVKAVSEKKPREDVAKLTLPQYAAYPFAQATPYLMGGIFDELKK